MYTPSLNSGRIAKSDSPAAPKKPACPRETTSTKRKREADDTKVSIPGVSVFDISEVNPKRKARVVKEKEAKYRCGIYQQKRSIGYTVHGKASSSASITIFVSWPPCLNFEA